MKRLLFLPLLLTLVFVACGSENEALEFYDYGSTEYYGNHEPEETQIKPGEISQEIEERPYIHGLLSYVKYGENRAYIFGSMHLGRPYFFPLPERVEEAMHRSDIFVFEFDLTQLGDLASMMEMARYMMLPLGTTLADILPPETHGHLLNLLETFPLVNYETISNFQPMVVSTLITALEIFPLMGISEVYSVDAYILSVAQGLNRPVIGLNPLAHEMSLLYRAPMDVQIAAIDYLTDRDTMIETARDLGLVEAYIEQDIDRLFTLLRPEEAFENPFTRYMLDVILIQRSVEFAEEIHRLLTQTQEPTTFFITMGIGHMIGVDQGNVFIVLEELGHDIVPLWQ